MELPPEAGPIILLTIIVFVPTGYILAWRSKRPAFRRVGALIVAIISGMAGLLCAWFALGMLFDWPGEPVINRMTVSLFPIFFAVGTFHIAARFVSRALRSDSPESETTKP